MSDRPSLTRRAPDAPLVPNVVLEGPESAAEHLRNALQLLSMLDTDLQGGNFVADIAALRSRIEAALARLERHA